LNKIFTTIVVRITIILTLLLGTIHSGPRHYVLAVDNQGTMEQQIDLLLSQEPAIKGAIAGISVRSASTGEIVYAHNGDTRLKPASNLKLLTAATALSTLGEDYTFRTEILTDGVVKKGELFGNLYLKGKGDPTLLKSDLDKMAKKLHESGIKSIRGDIVGDDTWYDNVRYSIDLPWSDEATYYGGQVSALTISPDHDYDSGTIIVKVGPSSLGKHPLVTLYPKTDYVKIKNHAKTVDAGEKRDITITREHGKNVITIEGTIPKNTSEMKEWVAIWEPTGYALDLFKQSLTANEITLHGDVRAGNTPQLAKEIIGDSSIPLSELLITFMKQSNNGHGETLIKEIGKTVKDEGSWESGLEVVKNELAKFGMDTSKLVLRDGSGISHVNLVPANELSKLLFKIQNEKWFNSYLNSLPISGAGDRIIGGTLFNRMNSLPDRAEVRAKTGTITTVSSLSGYVKTKSGEKFTFSILLNNLVDESKGKGLEDKIVSIVANQ
jgi:D-alanyl-D-alanine carboxypeptidase/D-alanyl-D-alanine-endopeptidase (penicillin-binding protein 4)